MNRGRDALSLLEKLIEIDPEDFNPYLGIASIKKTLGKSIGCVSNELKVS